MSARMELVRRGSRREGGIHRVHQRVDSQKEDGVEPPCSKVRTDIDPQLYKSHYS